MDNSVVLIIILLCAIVYYFATKQTTTQPSVTEQPQKIVYVDNTSRYWSPPYFPSMSRYYRPRKPHRRY